MSTKEVNLETRINEKQSESYCWYAGVALATFCAIEFAIGLGLSFSGYLPNEIPNINNWHTYALSGGIVLGSLSVKYCIDKVREKERELEKLKPQMTADQILKRRAIDKFLTDNLGMSYWETIPNLSESFFIFKRENGDLAPLISDTKLYQIRYQKKDGKLIELKNPILFSIKLKPIGKQVKAINTKEFENGLVDPHSHQPDRYIPKTDAKYNKYITQTIPKDQKFDLEIVVQQ
jgi:hypothetical protein